MVSFTLVISNPPHAGSLNLASAAPLLDLQPEELRLKAKYGVPEIWLAEEQEAQATGYARALGMAGFRLVTIDAAALAAVPSRTVIARFEFKSMGLEAQTEAETVTVPYDQRIVGVHCTLREPDPTPPFLDLYIYRHGTLARLTVEQGMSDLRGLLAERKIGVVANLPTMVSTCEKRFPNVVMDRRLMDMHLRKRSGLPAKLVEKRKGFSFATPQLSRLLESLQPGLGTISQTELSSRLVFLTHVGKNP